MKRIALFALPIMILVYILSARVLNHNFSEIDPQTRFYIAIGAALFSGLISYFLFKSDTEQIDTENRRSKK